MRLSSTQHVTAKTVLHRHGYLAGVWRGTAVKRHSLQQRRCIPAADGQQPGLPLAESPVDIAADAAAAAPSYPATAPIQPVLFTPADNPVTGNASSSNGSNGTNGSSGSTAQAGTSRASSAHGRVSAGGKAADISDLPTSSYPIEVKRILGLALPLALQNVAGFSLSVICAVSIGRLGPMYLAASVLANSLYNVTGYSIAMGLSAGMETQAYGAKNYKAVGLVLQRALLVCWSVCIPVAVLWLNSGPLLVALGQEADIAMLAGRYLALCIPCLFLGVAMECIKKYLQTQRVVKPTMIIAGITTALAPLYFWAWVFKGGLGLDGAAFAFISCQLTSLSLMLSYVVWRTKRQAGRPDQTWGGWSKDAFKGWGTYLNYGLPAAAMICMEWWAFEVIVLMAGVLPDAQVALSVMGICLQITAWVYMLPAGLASAVNTCMSAALGAAHAASARRIFRVSLLCALGLQAVVIAGVLLGREALVKLFCSDPAVVARALDVLPVLAGLMVFDGINATVSGVLRGAGRQKLGAVINAVGYWAVGIPLAWLLSFQANLGIHGLWLGIGCGGLVQAITLVGMVWRWDWPQEVERVRRLVQDIDGNGAPLLATGH